MANGATVTTVTYISPAWGLIPTQDQMHKLNALHVQLKFAEDSGNLEVLHNLNLPWGAPLQEPQWLAPLVVINAIAGGKAASLPTVKVKDGNTLEFGRINSGPGTDVTLDVWIFRQLVPESGSWFSRL